MDNRIHTSLTPLSAQAYVSPVLQLVERSGEVPESPELKQQIAQELRRNTDIAALIGDSMGEFLAYEDEEIDVFRQKMLKRIVRGPDAHTHTHKHTHKQTSIHAFTHIHTHTYIHIHSHIHIHIHIHIHTQVLLHAPTLCASRR